MPFAEDQYPTGDLSGQRHRAGHRTDLADAQRHHHPLPAHAAGQPWQVTLWVPEVCPACELQRYPRVSSRP
jgi:hypothetical protein